MAKFGELIRNRRVVVMQFNRGDGRDDIFAVSDHFEKEQEIVKVISIDTYKNQELSDALRVNNTPHYFIYLDGQQVKSYGRAVKLETILTGIENVVECVQKES